mmetsp:Transcript_6754/g.41243  ORF Transcript_6754/g.41243 Transcript_6754/m.41243 type:complete len:428 (-) Transcript_6754:40-1323(-)
MAEDDGRTLRRRASSPMKSINKGARGLLGQTTLAELVRPKRVLVRGMRVDGGNGTRSVLTEHDVRRTWQVLSSSMTIGEALARLAKHKVLSAPMLKIAEDGPRIEFSDEWPEDVPYPDIVGFVGVRDILDTCLSDLQEALENISKPQTDMLKTMAHLKLIAPDIESRKIENIQGFDGDFLFQNQAKCSLLDVLVKAFLVPKRTTDVYRRSNSLEQEESEMDIHKAVHRLGLFDTKARVTGVVSQSDVLNFLVEHMDHLGSITKHTVEEIGLGMPKPVICVDSTTSALQAFDKMYKHNLSAVGVVSPNTHIIIGNLSMSDLRCLSFENFGYLVLPVSEFLVLLASNRGEDVETPHQVQQKPALLTVSPESAFAEVLHMFSKNRIHRVYVVDSQSGVPVGVITPTDVIQAVTTTVYQKGEQNAEATPTP